MTRIAPPRGEIHPDIMHFDHTEVAPTPDSDFLQLHRVIAHLDPALLLRLQIGKEVRRSFAVARQHALE